MTEAGLVGVPLSERSIASSQLTCYCLSSSVENLKGDDCFPETRKMYENGKRIGSQKPTSKSN